MGYKGYIKWTDTFEGEESTGEYAVLVGSVHQAYDKLYAIAEAESRGQSVIQEVSIQRVNKD